MSDGDSGPAAAPSRRTRLRRFLGGRSSVQKLGVLAAVAVLATAPFGGLAEADRDEQPLSLGEEVDVGPFDVTLEQVVSIGDLAPAATPQPGNRLLVLDVTVTNHSDRAEPARLITGLWGGDGTGAVPWPGEDAPRLRLFNPDDAVEVSEIEVLNPGQTVRLAMILEQLTDWDPDRLTLELRELELRETDPFTLSDPYWVTGEVVRTGHVETEAKP